MADLVPAAGRGSAPELGHLADEEAHRRGPLRVRPEGEADARM